VLQGTGSFEEVPPSVEEMVGRFEASTARSWCWLVACDATGVLGYAYYSQYKNRSAYPSPPRTVCTYATTCAAKGWARRWWPA